MNLKKKKHPWPVKNPYKKIFPTHLLIEQGRWFYLFHALIGLLFLYPYLHGDVGSFTTGLLALLNTCVILVIAYTASYNKRQFVFALILALPALLVLWIPHAPYSREITLLSTGLIYLYAIILIVPYLVHSEEVGTEEIFGATSLYILIGLVWATLYQWVEILAPNSFYLEAAQNIDHVMDLSDFLFFSFTTLTTLGYGDITPVTAQARSLSILEAITGVIFIAGILSRAIGLYVAQSLEKKKQEKKS